MYTGEGHGLETRAEYYGLHVSLHPWKVIDLMSELKNNYLKSIT
jgi:hypothetical protein